MFLLKLTLICLLLQGPGCLLTNKNTHPSEQYHRASMRKGQSRLKVAWQVGKYAALEVGVMV